MTRRLECRSHKLENHPVTVIELAGQIDSPDSLKAIDEAISVEGVEHVAVMLNGVEYINSRGCAEMISLHRKVEDSGFHIYFVKPVSGVKRVMEHVGCTRILRVVDTLEDVISDLEA